MRSIYIYDISSLRVKVNWSTVELDYGIKSVTGAVIFAVVFKTVLFCSYVQ